MTDELDALLAAVHDKPQDTLPRLVYADWLDDRGEAEYAEFIRLGAQDENRPRRDDLYQALIRRWGLRQEEERLWWTEDRTILADIMRVTVLFLLVESWRCPKYFRPRKLVVIGHVGWESEALASPYLVRAEELSFNQAVARNVEHETMNDPLLDELSRFPGHRLRVLRIEWGTLSFAALSRFAVSPLVERLERFSFGLPRRLYPYAEVNELREITIESPGDGRLTHALEVIANRYPGFAPPP
jgi:uncharacterized protein (TIGR02996 family)